MMRITDNRWISMKNTGFTLVEIFVVIGIIGIITAGVHRLMTTNVRSHKTTKDYFDAQNDAKIALHKIAHEIRNARDLCRASDWESGTPVESTFLTFQKFADDIFSTNWSTVTYHLDGDKLYRTETSQEEGAISEVLLRNLHENYPVFHILDGDLKSTLGRKITISLKMKVGFSGKPKIFETTAFVQNPPMGDYVHDMP